MELNQNREGTGRKERLSTDHESCGRWYQDSLVYEIPDGSYIEKMPESVLIESDFGTYEVNYQMVDGKFIYTRSLKSKKGRYDKERYKDLIEFYKAIRRNDRKKILISLST